MNRTPRISVITIAFNDQEGLRSTMASVLAQTYPNLEYIVVDGGSTDGSIDLIRQHAPSLARWVCEPDNGIYDALNKGARLCTGDWVIFMNAGDDFASPNIVSEVFSETINPDLNFIYGDRIVKYPGYQVLHRAGPTEAMWKGSQFSHQSIFIRGDFQRKNLYQLNIRISADFALFFEACAAGLKFKKLDYPIACVSAGGLSDRARLENIAEFYRVVRRVRPSFKVHLYFLCMLALQSIKLTAKRLLPEQWVHRYRHARKTLV